MYKMTLQVKYNLNDIGKCCGPTAHKLLQQMPIQDILSYGTLTGTLEVCFLFSNFILFRIVCIQGIAHPLMTRKPD